MNAVQLKRIQNRISGWADEAVRIQKQLTACPALSPENGGIGEWRKAEKVKSLLDETGWDECIALHAPDKRVPEGDRPNWIIKFKGKSSARTNWIMSHLDVVPPGELSRWEHDPYDAFIRDGKVFGRGTEDNHQAVVSSILAVRALREEGIVPEYDIGLAVVSDEETSSTYGIGHVLKTRPDLFRKQDVIVVPDAGDPLGTIIETSEKSILWIRFEVIGKQTHGSTPEKGANAHKAGSHLIVQLDSLHQVFGKSDPLFDPPISTFEPTKKENNIPNINTVPGEDVFYFDCRILPDYRLQDVQNRIRSQADEIEKRFGVRIQIQYLQIVQAPPSTPQDAPAVLALQQAVRDVLGREARTCGIGGGTVAAHFRELGLPAVCWTCIDDTAHEPNEYSRIDYTLNDAKVFAHLFLQP